MTRHGQAADPRISRWRPWAGRVPALAAAALLAACATGGAAGDGGGVRADGQLTLQSSLHVADAAVQGGNDQLAQTMYARVAADPKADPQEVIAAAEGLLHFGLVPQAQSALEARLRDTPGNLELRRALLRLHVVSGAPAAAIAEADALLARSPEDTTALADKGVALDLLGRHDEAQAVYRRALARAPTDADLRTDLALSEVLSGQSAQAKADLAGFATRSDAPARARTMLALLYVMDGDQAAARPLLGEGVDEGEVAALAQAIRRRGAGPANTGPVNTGPAN